MKTTIDLTHAYTNWVLNEIKENCPKQYEDAKTQSKRNTLVREYVLDILYGHKADRDDLGTT